MQQFCTYGSVRGAISNGRPYRDKSRIEPLPVQNISADDCIMRGDDHQQFGVFSYVSPEERVPQDHPLRPIRKAVDEVFRAMNQDFDGLYASTGRPSIPPERLLRALLLQIFYSVRSERMLMEQLSYNLLFRWFVGMEMDEPVWNHAVFSKNRERLLNQEVARAFFARVLAQAKPHLSAEHFSVDGTLIEAWASQKSFQRKDGGDTDGSQFRGDKRSNDSTSRKPIRTPSSTGKAMDRKPSWAICGTC